MALRIALTLALLFSVLFLPFYISLILALFCMFYFRFYLEAVLLFLLSDLLFGAREERFFGIVFVSVIVSIILFGAIEFFKSRSILFPKPQK